MEYNDKLVFVSWWIWTALVVITWIIIAIKGSELVEIVSFGFLSWFMLYLSIKMLIYWKFPEAWKRVHGDGENGVY